MKKGTEAVGAALAHSKPSLSVVVVCYENPDELQRTLRSIRQANDQGGIQCIVVDGSPRSPCAAIVAQYSSCIHSDDEVIYIVEEDAGPYDAMNKGTKKASADFVWFLNSGDECAQSLKLSQIVDELYAASANIYCFPVAINSKSGIPLETTVRTAEGLRYQMGPHQGMIFRRESLIAYGGYEVKYKYIADYDLVLRMLDVGCVVETKSILLANFYLGGLSSTSAKEMELARYRIKPGLRARLQLMLRLVYLRLK